MPHSCKEEQNELHPPSHWSDRAVAGAPDSKGRSDPHRTRPCGVTFPNLQDLPESLAPPVLHLPGWVPGPRSRPWPECSPAPRWGRGSGGLRPRRRLRRWKKGKPRGAYQLRALSRAPPASGSPRASCARRAASAAAGALAAAMEAAEGAGPAAVALAPLPRQRREHVPHSGGRSRERSAEPAPAPAPQRAAGRPGHRLLGGQVSGSLLVSGCGRG